MEFKEIIVGGKKLKFIVTSDDEVEENDKIDLNDTLDLTDMSKDIETIIVSSDLNE